MMMNEKIRNMRLPNLKEEVVVVIVEEEEVYSLDNASILVALMVSKIEICDDPNLISVLILKTTPVFLS